MTKPQTITSLIGALEGASDALQSAKSQRQRVQRNDRLIAAGLALHARLEELHEWLDAYFAAKGDDDKYLENLTKYQDGWKAMDAVEHAIDRWIADHYIEESNESLSGLRPGGSTQREAAPPVPRFTRKEVESQAKRGSVAMGGTGGRGVRPGANEGGRSSLPVGGAVQQSLLT